MNNVVALGGRIMGDFFLFFDTSVVFYMRVIYMRMLYL